MDQLIKLSKFYMVQDRSDSFSAGLQFLTRHIDILLVSWFLSSELLVVYLLARSASMIIPLALAFLGGKVAPQLQELLNDKSQHNFQAAAARVNLGYLMVCGAIALLVLMTAPQLVAILGVNKNIFHDVLVWTVLGQSTPILFGATGLLMRIVHSSFFISLQVIIAGLFVTSLAFSSADNAIQTAQSFAVAQLTQAAICAMILTRYGIWPGLTALFHKEIKLF